MRIRRIRVEHFRGVAAREVELSARGVTIVEGPNEVGKSSLADAVDVLFDELHTTTKASVRELQPIGHDVGTTVEVDAELGDHVFTYRKTFNREREAVLHLHAPTTGTWTGREAHERMERLLSEQLDVELWRALRTAQGDTVAQADLCKTTSLVEALDRAAGTTTTTGVEESLYAAVVAEHERYFTPTGRDGTELKRVDAAVELAAAEVERRSEAFAAVERDVTRYEELERRVVDLRARTADAHRVAEQRQARWREVEALSEAVVSRREARDLASERLGSLSDRILTRRSLVTEVAAAEERIAELAAARDAAAEPLGEAVAAVERVEADVAAGRGAVERVDTELREVGRRLERAHDARELERAREQLAAARAARGRRLDAERVLAGMRVDGPALARIRAADQELQVAAAALDAAAPAVRVELAEGVALTVDGEPRGSDDGGQIELAVPGTTVLGIGDAGTVTIRPADDLTAQEARRTRAAAELQEALDAVQQPSVTSAVSAAADRAAAEQRLEVARGSEADAGDADALEVRVAALSAAVGDDASRDRLDVDQLRSRRAELEDERRRQVAGRDAAEDALREARATAQARREVHDDLTHRLTAATDAHERLAGRLAAERAETDDESLARAVADAERRLREAEAAQAEASERLGGEDPDAVRVLAENATDAARRAAAELHDAEGELREVGARIEVTGEEGRFERLEEARAELAHAERERDHLRRRAAAAALLHEQMSAARDRARRAYLRPLQERIEGLGRLALGGDLRVELDEESLAIDRVVRDGVPLPFAALSVGAQEQLAVIQRLACAMLVCRDGASGVPVVLDDALGFSDPSRLEAMGAVLRLAGEHCQVLVLTCMPDRYRHVGDADVVRLG